MPVGLQNTGVQPSSNKIVISVQSISSVITSSGDVYVLNTLGEVTHMVSQYVLKQCGFFVYILSHPLTKQGRVPKVGCVINLKITARYFIPIGP